MLVHKKGICFAAAVLGLVVVMSACGKSPEEQVYAHLEEAVSLEEDFEQQQEPLMELEQQEQNLYEEMLTLGSEELEEIEELADEAISYAEERKGLLEYEKESIEEAYEEYKLGEEQMENVEGAEEEAEAVKDAMNKRYDTYQSLYESYEKAISDDIVLYEAFTKEDLTIEELQSHIDDVNETYKKVVDNRDLFNEYTDDYNEAKQAFYEASSLEITAENEGEEETSDNEEETEE
ncbi:YkyA family protein [Alteribacillus sp. JSM 102045]|uniref:YkyA family protein n=1 Tax=Alteribacillus sp. JSM 102045 TaxID=1562101 RepID=UPI0035BEF360